MRCFPILQELLASDSVLFLLIGLVLSGIAALKLKSSKRNLTGMLVSLVLYALCEVLSNIRIRPNYMLDLVLLFIGTIAIGAFIGFAIGFIAAKTQKR